MDLKNVALLLGKSEPSILTDYIENVANRELLGYRSVLQWGNKRGESLYTHVLNGVMVLDTLRQPLNLDDVEARVLYSAFTIHDINKVLLSEVAFSKLAVRENIAPELKRIGLDAFFPQWETYLEDITSLVRGHSGHMHSGGERMFVKYQTRYGLDLDRVNALLYLMRAADVIDLSHTLEEQSHKNTFLSNLNAYLANSGQKCQYNMVTHRLTEQRGLLSNVLHNAIAEELAQRFGVIPLLYYPDGIVYLFEQKQTLDLGEGIREQIAHRAATSINNITRGKFSDFITSTGQGIKVDAKCLELSIPFAGENGIWNTIDGMAQRRNYDPVDLDTKARNRARRDFEKNKKANSDIAEKVQLALDDVARPVVASEVARLRQAELARTYYIFLLTYFKDRFADPWKHIYDLLELPQERWSFYEYFDARYDRSYVLACDLTLDEETLYRRIEADGQALLGGSETETDSKIPLLKDYLERYLVFSVGSQPQVAFGEALAHYVASQHKQCVYCSSPYPTDKWMTGDVRSDITVQVFSNRLLGGPGEPKKNICAICQLQFLLEKLNYPKVRNEKMLYLHLFPYSFLTRPFIEGLLNTIREITGQGVAINALNMDAAKAIETYIASRNVTPNFRAITKKDKPQPYGLYLPRYSETTGNLLIFPVNPAGDNDTEQFLFAFWNALLIQRHLGVKVMMSKTAIPPLEKEAFGDLYVDNIPLAVQGLLPENDYREYKPDQGKTPDNLPKLWERVGHLFRIRRLTSTDRDHIPRLVRALTHHPLAIFYETDRLIEARTRGEKGGLVTWMSQQAFEAVQSLSQINGGVFMDKLSQVLQSLAEIAWQNGLRGDSLERSSLLYSFHEVMQKLAQVGGTADNDALKAAASQEIFDHLERIAKRKGYSIGRKKAEASAAFVSGWFEDVLEKVYGGNARKLMADEKMLRSAFLFYIRQQISQKASQEEA